VCLGRYLEIVLKEIDHDRAEKFLELFSQGRAFTEELLAENQRLRHRLAAVEQAFDATEVRALREQIAQLDSERREISERFRAVEEMNRDYADRFREIEEQNNNLANLYVAGYQLHSTLDFREVIEIVKEIMINLIGAEVFAILLLDETNDVLESIGWSGVAILPGVDRIRVRVGKGPIGWVASSGENFFAERDLRRRPDLNEPLVVIPLKINQQLIGVLATFSVLHHKEAFTAVDYELFSLLAAQAAAAIFSAKLYSQSERKLNTIQNFLDLLTASY
jgi:GAF domain-containing protein